MPKQTEQLKEVVAVVIEGQSGRILLMQRGRKAKNQIGKWENSGGGVESGEDPISAIKREVEEELGAKLEIVKEIYRDKLINESGQVVIGYVFLGHLLDEPRIMEPEKCSGLQWVLPKDLGKVALADYAEEDFKRMGLL